MYRNRSKQRRNESDEEGERAIWPLFLSVPGGRIRRRRLRSSLKYVSSGEGGNWNIGGPSTDSNPWGSKPTSDVWVSLELDIAVLLSSLCFVFFHHSLCE
ncbi:unnamed protein product [Arabidopsis halleri]